MPKRIRKPKLDTVQNARRVMLESVGAIEPDAEAPAPQPRSVVSQVMAEMGRRGGLIEKRVCVQYRFPGGWIS